MKIKEKSLFYRMASLALAMVMAFSVIIVMPESADAAQASFKSKGKSSVTIADESCYTATGELTLIKFKASKDGYLKVQASMASAVYTDYVVGRWQLYDSSKKKALSPINYYNTNYTDISYYTDCFGVKKGKTYYLAVQADGGVKLTASFTATKAGGSKKTKAKSVSKGKEMVGSVAAGTSSAQWYKFNIPSNKKLNVYLTPYMTGNLNMTLSGPGVYTRTFTISSSYWGKQYKTYTSGKVKSGTYYIKIQPSTKSSNGFYKLKWK